MAGWFRALCHPSLSLLVQIGCLNTSESLGRKMVLSIHYSWISQVVEGLGVCLDSEVHKHGSDLVVMLPYEKLNFIEVL